jgi:hypothetical protein
MEDTVIDLTELVSPVDMSVRQGFEIKCEEYRLRVLGKEKPWQQVFDFRERHQSHPDFRDAHYKFFICKALLNKQPGEKLIIVNEFQRLEELVGNDNVDRDIFENVCLTIHGYITGELPLPKPENKV